MSQHDWHFVLKELAIDWEPRTLGHPQPLNCPIFSTGLLPTKCLKRGTKPTPDDLPTLFRTTWAPVDSCQQPVGAYKIEKSRLPKLDGKQQAGSGTKFVLTGPLMSLPFSC